jgi:CBS domain-containing protein
MTNAREIMHSGVECIKSDESLADAAIMMRDLHVGALPICGDDDRLHGIITDRDIVVKCVAEGRDPEIVTAQEFAQGTPVWIAADADSSEVLQLMEDNQIRRLPVIEDSRLVGMISESDLAAHLSESDLNDFVTTLYTSSPTT